MANPGIPPMAPFTAPGNAQPDGITISYNSAGRLQVFKVPPVDVSVASPITNTNNQIGFDYTVAGAWSGLQTFGNNISIGGAQLAVSSLALNNVLQYNGTNWVNAPISVTVSAQANASDTELTTTSATTIATFTPSAQGNFMVMVYYVVTTATTSLTLTATWADSFGSRIYSWVAGTNEAVGAYAKMPLYINAVTTNPITVSATAGTANQVYVSASIIQIT